MGHHLKLICTRTSVVLRSCSGYGTVASNFHTNGILHQIGILYGIVDIAFLLGNGTEIEKENSVPDFKLFTTDKKLAIIISICI